MSDLPLPLLPFPPYAPSAAPRVSLVHRRLTRAQTLARDAASEPFAASEPVARMLRGRKVPGTHDLFTVSWYQEEFTDTHLSLSWDAFIDRCTTLLYAVKRSCDLIIASAEWSREQPPCRP